ncbi:LAMI_0D09934g1_1 [Lachancea mirantina]|uniref:LAMI_0D09934g1_1 n=1 Tax=Lachancea mirantina TaxID=1230905 RepID=A0A1G4JDW3_9SACH|nr:LAMI_0D09934g1_1 [Lachancea mirantina]
MVVSSSSRNLILQIVNKLRQTPNRFLLKSAIGTAWATMSQNEPSENAGSSQSKQGSFGNSAFLHPSRSILKQRMNEQDSRENLTIPTSTVLEEPSHSQNDKEENNTTSRINTAKLKAERRVSFAPDVTLHKFDFVEARDPPSIRMPRRRQHDIAKPFTSDYNVSLTRNDQKDADDSNMDLTYSNNIGTAQQQIVKPTYYEKDMEGNPKRLSSPYEPVFNQEVSMEITQLFSKHSARPQDSTGESLAMETSSKQRKSEDGETMEITDFQQIEKLRRPEDLDLEARHGQNLNVSSSPVSATHRNDDPKETSMELTAMNLRSSGPARDEIPFSEHPNFRPSQIVTSTQSTRSPNAPTRLNTKNKQGSTRGGLYEDEHDGKRRKLSTSGNGLDHTFSGHTLKVAQEDMDLTSMERLSPIELSATVDEIMSSQNLGSIKNAIFDWEKSPHRNEKSEHQQLSGPHTGLSLSQNPISLLQFLTASGMAFRPFEDLSAEKFAVKFEYISPESKQPTLATYISLHAQMPILEIYAFCCKELLRRTAQSKKAFDELEEHFKSNTVPLLFTSLINSSDARRTGMLEKMKLVQQASKLQARKVWFEWRAQHLKGIKSVLDENLFTLKEELKEVDRIKDKTSNVRHRLGLLKRALMREFQVSRKSREFRDGRPSLEKRLEIERIKKEFERHSIQVHDGPMFSGDKKLLGDNINSLSTKLSKIKEEINVLRRNREPNEVSKTNDLARLNLLFDLIEKLSGFKLVNWSDKTISVRSLQCGITFNFNLEKLESTEDMSYDLEIGITDFSREIQHNAISAVKSEAKTSNFPAFMLKLQKACRLIKKLEEDYEVLKLLYPTKVLKTAQGFNLLEIRYRAPALKMNISFSVQNLRKAFFENDVLLLTVEYFASEVYQVDAAISSLRSQTKHVLPWLLSNIQITNKH